MENPWLEKDEYRNICKQFVPSIYEWQIDLGYQYYVASLSGNEELASKKLLEMNLNNIFFADGMFN